MIKLKLNLYKVISTLVMLAVFMTTNFVVQYHVGPASITARAYTGLVGSSATCDYYAATNGTSGGSGSAGSPWDLRTALNKTLLVTAGKTLCLKSGTYIGRFTSNLEGANGNPVVIRSAPGEWAKIDGNFSTVLTADFSDTDTTLTVDDVSNLPAAGDLFGAIIDDEIFRIYGRTGNVLNVYDRRPIGNPHGASNHLAGAQLLVNKSIFEVAGDYTTVRDFEITNSSTQRITLDSERGAGVNTVVAGTDVINMVIHDVGHPGIGFWDQVGDGGEIYGSIIWGNGEYDDGGSWLRGAGVYTQNQNGTRYLTDNIWFRNFTEGIDVFTTNGYANGYDIEGNISFDHQASQNFWVGSQNVNPIERLKIISNYGYHRGPYSTDPQTDFGLGYTTYNIDAEVRDNYMVSNNVTFSPKNFETLLVTGNSIYLRGGSAQAQVNLEQNNKVSYTIDNNHYYGDNRFTAEPGGTGGIMSFAQWQSIGGYDANGTYSSSAPPDSYAVRPNAYQSGRANIAVYNWSNQSNVSVDVSSVLSSGDTYEVYDVENIFGSPIATGTYSGSNISIPMTSTTITPTVGTIDHADYDTHTPSEFGAFVLLSTPASPTVSTPSISPNGGSFSGTQSVTLSSSTSGATIRYTTDGSTPTSSSGTIYSTPFNISATTTVKAIAYKASMSDSSVATASFTLNPSDTTPPVISSVNSSGLSSSGATITWTTDEASDSQVDYGTTISYGSSSSLTDTTPKVTSHSVSLSGLSASTTYHYRVKSRDAAGNLATGTDNTFTTSATADTTNPTVSITAPSNSTTVTGSSVTVSASASDNIGVAGVQFKLDGSNLGSEDTTAPYSITWDSTAASNASHSITAVARDAAGNSTTSSVVSVTVDNTLPIVSDPTFSPDGGSFSTTQNVTLSTATSGATIRYTTDGSTPSDTVGTIYSIPFSLSATTTVKAIAYKSGETNSSVISKTFTKTSSSGGGGGGGGGGSSSGGSGGTVTTPTTNTPVPVLGTRLVNISGTYYLIENGVRKGVTSPGILYSCGFEFKDVTQALASDSSLPSGNLLLPCDGALVKSDLDKTIYLLSKGNRYAFTSSDVFGGLGFKFSSVLVVTNPELQSITRGADISSSNQAHLPGLDININGTIYWVDNNLQKHAYPSVEVYNSWHKDNDFTTVVPANSHDLNLVTGDVVPMRVLQK